MFPTKSTVPPAALTDIGRNVMDLFKSEPHSLGITPSEVTQALTSPSVKNTVCKTISDKILEQRTLISRRAEMDAVLDEAEKAHRSTPY